MDHQIEELLIRKLQLLEDLAPPIPYTIIRNVVTETVEEVVRYFYYDVIDEEDKKYQEGYQQKDKSSRPYNFYLNLEGKQELMKYDQLGQDLTQPLSITSWIRVLGFFAYKEKREEKKLDTCHEAQMKEMIPTYFRNVDILRLFKKK